MIRHRTTLLVAAAGLTACLGLNDQEIVTTIWETDLVAELTFPDLTGQAAAVSQFNGTQVGVEIAGAETGVEHAWGLWTGTCANPVSQIGPDTDYPVLAADLSGRAESNAYVGTRLAPDGSYFVEVRTSPTDATRVACGDLVRSGP